jgi:hypothetical protein
VLVGASGCSIHLFASAGAFFAGALQLFYGPLPVALRVTPSALFPVSSELRRQLSCPSLPDVPEPFGSPMSVPYPCKDSGCQVSL